MPRKVNIDLEYQRRMSEIDRRYKEALEDAEAQLKKRKEKLEAWKAGELALQADAEKSRKEREGKPRMSKLDREIQEAKERQKEQFQKSKEEVVRREENKLPTIKEEKRAEVFSIFTSLMDEGASDKEEDEEFDQWDLSGMTHDSKISYIKSKVKQGEDVPADLLALLDEEKKGDNFPKKVSFSDNSEKPAEEAKAICPETLDSENVNKGENSVEIPPQEPLEVRTIQTIPRPTSKYYYTPQPVEEEERPVIISNTKVKKQAKVALKR